MPRTSRALLVRAVRRYLRHPVDRTTTTPGTIYIFGGYPGCCGSYLNTVFAYNQTTDTWSARASMPTPREGPAAALASDGKIYVVGGNGTGSTAYYAVEAYDPTTNTWQSKAPMPIGQSGLSLIPAPNGKLYGIGYDAAGTVLSYDPSTDAWATEAPLPTPRGHVLGALAADGDIYAIGGFLFQPYGAVSAVTERASLTPDTTPSVTSVSPSQGLLAGGTAVTITGSGFADASAVEFGTSAAISFTVNSDTSITATAPPATSAGTVDVTVTTPAGVSPSGTADYYTYLYAFTGFLQPVDNPPTENTMRAGAAVPVKFGLGGYQGLNIFATGFPVSQRVDCVTAAPLDAIDQTSTAGQSSLSYDTTTGQYTYVWKTDKAWKNTCRTFDARLVDGSDHIAIFKY